MIYRYYKVTFNHHKYVYKIKFASYNIQPFIHFYFFNCNFARQTALSFYAELVSASYDFIHEIPHQVRNKEESPDTKE